MIDAVIIGNTWCALAFFSEDKRKYRFGMFVGLSFNVAGLLGFLLK